MNATHTTYATEICGTDDTAFEFREVIEAEVHDFGGNVLAGPAPVGEAVVFAAMQKSIGRKVKVIPTKLGMLVDNADIVIY